MQVQLVGCLFEIRSLLWEFKLMFVNSAYNCCEFLYYICYYFVLHYKLHVNKEKKVAVHDIQ